MRLRINVVNPPAGVDLRMQRGARELVEPTAASVARVTFDFDVRLGTRTGGLPNFLGEFTQGPPASRFVYLNWGQCAGQTATPWSRRAKIPLTSIGRALIDRANRTGGVVTVDVEGTGRDGGPTCGTIKLMEDAWRIAPD